MSFGWGWGWGWAMFAPSGTLFEDSFTSGSPEAIDAHTPDTDTSGNGWTENMGTTTVSGGMATTTEDQAVHLFTCDVSRADCTIQTDYRYYPNTGDIQGGLAVRCDSDCSNYWLVVLDPSDSLLKIIKCEFGQAPSVKKSAAITGDFQDNTWYTVKAICSDTTITAHCINGANDDSISHNEEWMNTETRHGCYGYYKVASDTMDFDDFSIEL